jgi:hypothetical protein
MMPTTDIPDHHYYSECAGRGMCDRELGVCRCFDGFTGSACDRNTCPNDCSGHGTCKFIKDLNPDVAYTEWDAEQFQSCECDGGWEGADCSLRMCPKGDDPLTPSTADQDVTVTIAGATTITAGKFVLEFTDALGYKFNTSAIDVTASADDVKTALQTLPQNVIPSVTVGAGPLAITIQFDDAANTGDQTLACHIDGCNHAGCQPLWKGAYHGSDFSAVALDGSGSAALTAGGTYDGDMANCLFEVKCSGADDYVWRNCERTEYSGTIPITTSAVTLTDGVTAQWGADPATVPCVDGEVYSFTAGVSTCTVATTTSSDKESAECSNRGLCDRELGLCRCHSGFRGLDCSEQTILAM